MVVTRCKMIWIPELTRLMNVNSRIHEFAIELSDSQILLESEDLVELESTRGYKIHGVE